MRLGSHVIVRGQRASRVFLDYRGVAAWDVRQAQIAALESKLWRGVRVYKVRCDADFGRGPHDEFLPEGVLWALIDLRHYRCPYHR